MARKNQENNPDTLALVRERKATEVDLLPAEIQAALAQYQTKERIGVAPQWKPEHEGDYIIGQVNKAGTHPEDPESFFLTLDATVGTKAGKPNYVGAQTVWLSADLKIKLARNLEEATGLVDKNFIIVYTGLLTKKERPSLMNDMKLFRVIEVMAPSAPVPPAVEKAS